MFEIYNEDCLNIMKNDNFKNSQDIIITSPPYNMTNRKGGYADSGRYDVYNDWKTEEDYIEWTVNLYKSFNQILKKNKVIVYNFGYSIENPSLPYKIVASIENNTNFTLVDTIIWKKKNGLPFPANKHRLSRIWEFVWVFCRKEELKSFDIYKQIKSVSAKTKQKYYEVFYNWIDAKNNDGKTNFNQATFSTQLVDYILSIYGEKGYNVFDPFSGTGTTGVSSIKNNMNYIGCEISEQQCQYSIERIKNSL